MPASTDSARSPSSPTALTPRPAAGTAALLLVILLAALAVGLWPGAIYRPDPDTLAEHLPVLQCVAVGLTCFFLLVWPAALAMRSQRMGRGPRWGALIGESALWLIVAVPVMIVAGFLSDATVQDGARAMLLVVMQLPLAWLAGCAMSRRGEGANIVGLALLCLLVGLPAGCYIAREFVGASPVGAAQWLWRLGPATLAWETAASRTGGWLARPLLAAVVWPVAAVGVALAAAVIGKKKIAGSEGGASDS